MRLGFSAVLFLRAGVTALLLVSASLFFGANTAVAHDAYGSGLHDDPKILLPDVEPGNEADLKSFVLHAAKHIESADSPNDIFSIRLDSEKDGSWKSGNLFLVAMDEQGASVLHGGYPTVGRDGGILSGFEDDNGEYVVRNLIAAAKAKPSGEAGPASCTTGTIRMILLTPIPRPRVPPSTELL